MYRKILEKIEHKNFAILGFGKEGNSTYNFVRRYLPNKSITIIDMNTNLIKENEELSKDPNVKFILGDNYLDNLNSFDFIMKSPGIKIPDDIYITLKDKVSSQIDIILELDRENIIGITGTKGKSTTSSLLYQVLKDQGKDTLLLGNVGNSVFDYIEKIKKDTILVIEMSSYQLDNVQLSPHIGVLLNLYEDHLNYHGSLKEYHYAKLNMFKYQNESDIRIFSSIEKKVVSYFEKNNYISRAIDVNEDLVIDNNIVYYKNKEIYNKKDKRFLIGSHNFKNILFVLRIAILLNLDLESTKNTINNFKPLKHRMEFIGEYNGIKYYDDTIATIPEATINCINALKEVDTLIFGGLDRGINYDGLIEFFNNSNITNFICMPDTGFKLIDKIKVGNTYKVETLEEAVEIAKKVTKKICLLSPAAPSYNKYKNFEVKGDTYRNLVQK